MRGHLLNGLRLMSGRMVGQLIQHWRRLGWAGGGRQLAAWAVVGLTGTQLPAPPPVPRRPSQSQVASYFLRAILRADYAAAYQRLAPEVRRSVTLGRFTGAARPLWQSGQRRHPQIQLYKLGVRLSDGGGARLFYSFSFAADSVYQVPPVQLEVTFRDTAARSVLGFDLRSSLPKLKARPSKAVAAPRGKGKGANK